MNIGECILAGLGMLVAGFVAIVVIACKYDLTKKNK